MNDTFVAIADHHGTIWLDTSFVGDPWMTNDAWRVLGASKLIFSSDGGADYHPAIIEPSKVRAYVKNSASSERVLGANLKEVLHCIRHGPA